MPLDVSYGRGAGGDGDLTYRRHMGKPAWDGNILVCNCAILFWAFWGYWVIKLLEQGGDTWAEKKEERNENQGSEGSTGWRKCARKAGG